MTVRACGPRVDNARAFGIGRGGIAFYVRAHDLAAATAQRVIVTARARLGRFAPAAKRAERIRSSPVAREVDHLRALGRRSHEAARRQPAIGLGSDEKVASG